MKVYVSPKAISPQDLKDNEMKTIRGGNVWALVGISFPCAIITVLVAPPVVGDEMTTV